MEKVAEALEEVVKILRSKGLEVVGYGINDGLRVVELWIEIAKG